jgi:hypothetical protein
MIRTWIVLLLSLPGAALADRIGEMPRTELCVYKARLSVAGYYYFLQGRTREAVTIHWHGDETPAEVEFVTRTIDEVYARAEAHKRAQGKRPLSEQEFGDQAYAACITGESL